MGPLEPRRAAAEDGSSGLAPGLLLITAGSPCQELTSAGTRGGELGLAGSQSVLYHAVPAIAR
eukprot:6427415-Lingulodinium_polyedra.AAC.1